MVTLVDGVTCEPLTAPDNGMIDCSLGGDGVPNEGETCKFSCNDGFELEGSTSRKCRSSGNWNGKDATCIGGMQHNHQFNDILKEYKTITFHCI